ncbi:MAG: anti-sigma factor [Algibacter sp.]|uniref:anti-sigma factor n=1 Tax=Algibacter sp. TaxID=1872428 RepID=UPI003298F1B2
MFKKMFLAVLAVGILASSCSNDDDGTVSSRLNISLDGLENLGNNFVYEGWLIVDGNPVSTGVFTVDDNGNLSETSFSILKETLDEATNFVLTIEPAVDPDPAPAETKLLIGDFLGDSASVSSAGIVADFASVSGNYILATPTDADDTNESSGVWFLDNSSGTAIAGLDLPILSAGWIYEGWVVFDGTPVSTGTFLDPAIADDNAATSPFKGSVGDGPAYPGEDYVMGTAAGVTFPTDLKGKTIVISVEPSPDNSAAPFTLKPLAHIVPDDAADHTVISMAAGPLTILTGTVTR